MNGEMDKRGFEQHMLEEDRVRADWNLRRVRLAGNVGIIMHGPKSNSVAKHSARSH